VIGQFRQNIATDSSEIEIIRNSDYHIYEETYRDRDSVWYSVHFIKDTTRLNTEGWKRKSGKQLGVWEEYDFGGQLLYTWDHDRGTCEVNKRLYPYHDMLQRMKEKADSIIVATYSQQFYENHVRFEYESYAYNRHKTKVGDDSLWTHDYLGSWTEAIKSRPNSFKFRYQVRLHKTDEDGIELGMDLDSLGNYVPSTDDFWNNYGFEEVIGTSPTFQIDMDKATEIAKLHGLAISDTSTISEFIFWENFKNQSFFNGQYRYYITDLTSRSEYKQGKDRQGVIYRYDVYSFNPWTGDFVEKKRMKSVHEWGQSSGHRTGLLPDNDK